MKKWQKLISWRPLPSSWKSCFLRVSRCSLDKKKRHIKYYCKTVITCCSSSESSKQQALLDSIHRKRESAEVSPTACCFPELGSLKWDRIALVLTSSRDLDSNQLCSRLGVQIPGDIFVFLCNNSFWNMLMLHFLLVYWGFMKTRPVTMIYSVI